MPTARINIISQNLPHRSDPVSLWSPRSTHNVNEAEKVEAMGVTFNLILYACVSSFFHSISLFCIAFTLMLQRKKTFKTHQGMQRSDTQLQWKCVEGKGFGIYWLGWVGKLIISLHNFIEGLHYLTVRGHVVRMTYRRINTGVAIKLMTPFCSNVPVIPRSCHFYYNNKQQRGNLKGKFQAPTCNSKSEISRIFWQWQYLQLGERIYRHANQLLAVWLQMQ